MTQRPDFLVIGAMKAGTTSFFNYLREHPKIFLPAAKELDYFVDGPEGTWHRGFDWYCSQFAGGGEAEVRGEVSPNYTKYPTFPGVPKRIRSVLGPDVKLVYLLRDPLERLKSHWGHTRSVFGTSPPLTEVALGGHLRACSNYAEQVEQYLDYFAPDQLLAITTEALEARPYDTIERVLRFLGVDGAGIDWDLTGRFHESGKKPYPRFGRWAAGLYRWGYAGPGKTRAAVRRSLTRRLLPSDLELPATLEDIVRAEIAEEVRRLEALTGVDTTPWRQVGSYASRKSPAGEPFP